MTGFGMGRVVVGAAFAMPLGNPFGPEWMKGDPFRPTAPCSKWRKVRR